MSCVVVQARLALRSTEREALKPILNTHREPKGFHITCSGIAEDNF